MMLFFHDSGLDSMRDSEHWVGDKHVGSGRSYVMVLYEGFSLRQNLGLIQVLAAFRPHVVTIARPTTIDRSCVAIIDEQSIIVMR